MSGPNVQTKSFHFLEEMKSKCMSVAVVCAELFCVCVCVVDLCFVWVGGTASSFAGHMNLASAVWAMFFVSPPNSSETIVGICLCFWRIGMFGARCGQKSPT